MCVWIVSRVLRTSKMSGTILLVIKARNWTVKYSFNVKPLTEYCIVVWAPYLRRDIDIVQSGATIMIYRFKSIEGIGMFSVEMEFLRGDMIQVSKDIFFSTL